MLIGDGVPLAEAQGKMVKMCLFYDRPSGHARSDPIISQTCASDHVHTFYGPLDFHPNTTYEDLIKTPPKYSTSPVVENQSLYWHPSIYRVTDNGDGTEAFTRVDNLFSSPYYRWDNSVKPTTEAFPPGFRMIAANTDPGANLGGENGSNMFTECCNMVDDEEDCRSWNTLKFPNQPCDFVGIAMNMPTCWNGELGDTNDHKDHMAYTLDGTVAGQCPENFNRRLPQLQLFVRITNYKGGKYQLSDGNDNKWHVDFFGGWQPGKLEKILEKCRPSKQKVGEFNPPCDCTYGDNRQTFLAENKKVAKTMCDSDVRRLIINEATDVTNSPPRGTCEGTDLIGKSWTIPTKDLYTCKGGGPGPCKDKKKDKFFWKSKRDDDGEIIGAKIKSCKWLKRRSKSQRNQICKLKMGNELNDPANIVCPVTCKKCTD